MKEQILKQNNWIDGDDFQITNTYFTEPINERKFATIIVRTSLEAHVNMLKKGFIIYGLKKSVINEHVHCTVVAMRSLLEIRAYEPQLSSKRTHMQEVYTEPRNK